MIEVLNWYAGHPWLGTLALLIVAHYGAIVFIALVGILK
jgi:hypothetical protein